jgi:Ca-activated chloride channel family protein
MSSILRLLLFSLLMIGSAAAQSEPDRSPQLLFQDNGKPRAILLEKLDTHVQIRGLLAETTMIMTFHNPHNRVLEGEMNFPLPEGATVSGYGLDVNGQLVEGVIVEKNKARVAFEAEVRKGVDPGLVEWTRGNSFKTRVYPIPAKGSRTVMVRYVSEIDGDATQGVFVLPMAFDGKISDVSLKVEVVRGTHEPEVLAGLANFSFEQWEDRWVAETSLSNATLDEDLRIALPKLPEQLVSIEQDGSDVFFLIHDSPPQGSEGAAKAPERIALYWDASLSREAEDKSDEIAFLRALLSRWKRVEVDVFVIRDTTERLGSWSIRRGDASELIGALDQVVYDGGTDLTSLDAPDASTDLRLLFTDGLGNIGHGIADTSASPIYTVTNRSNANHILLRYLASSSGGEHINLTRREAKEAATKIGDSRLRFLGVELESGEVTDVYPGGQQPVDGRFEVSGRLLTDSATVVLKYGNGETASHRVRLVLRRKDASETGMVPRFWAQQKVAELAVFPEENRLELLALGRRHNLVTPNTSLLVLETLEQHIEHDIEPPASRTEMREAWLARKTIIAQQEDQTQADHLERVVVLWQAKVAWWETDFTNWEVQASDKKDAQRSGAMEAEEEMMESPDMDDSAAMPESGMRREMSAGAASSSEAKAKKVGGVQATIKISAWDPQTPYMVIMKAAHKRGRAYESYIDQRIGYGDSPSYYLDVATWFYAQGDAQKGRRVLSSILDLDLDDPALLRVVAQRLLEAGDFDLAVSTFEDVLSMRPEEPQSYRDLGLALIQRGESVEQHYLGNTGQQGLRDLERGMGLLHHVVLHQWDRFAEIELIALMELNRTLALIEEKGFMSRQQIKRPDLDKRLVKNLDLDLRISLAWDADLTDIDLWVTEPTGEKAYFSNPLSAIGGKVSRDFTQGYGPEEYSLRTLIPGSYKIEANYYGSRQQTLVGPATVKAIIFTNYGRPTETRQEITLRLDNVKQAFVVGTVELGE